MLLNIYGIFRINMKTGLPHGGKSVRQPNPAAVPYGSLPVVVQAEVCVSAHAMFMHIQTVDFFLFGNMQPDSFI